MKGRWEEAIGSGGTGQEAGWLRAADTICYNGKTAVGSTLGSFSARFLRLRGLHVAEVTLKLPWCPPPFGHHISSVLRVGAFSGLAFWTPTQKLLAVPLM
jgi:hypothetical protein